MLLEKIKTSKKTSLVFLIIIISSYVVAFYPNMLTHDEYPDYYLWMQPYLNTCQLTSIPQFTNATDNLTENLRNPIKWWFNCASHKLGADNLIPSLFGIALIPLVYVLALQLSKDRIVSIIAITAFVLNPLFHDWSTSGVYDQTWAFFFLLSVYLITKLPLTSPFVFVLSIMTKALAVCYIPMWIYRVFKSDINEVGKVAVISIMSCLVLLGFIALMIMNSKITGTVIGFYPDHLWDGFARTLGILAISIPLLLAVFGLEISFRKYCKPILGRNESLLWVVSMILVTPIIYLFSGQFMFPYRFVPFDAFLSIYVGIVLTKVFYSFASLKRNNRLK